MAVEIVMPKLGMVMSEGTVARWAKSAGEAVSQGELIAEIETEKINYELEATAGGLFHPLVAEGAVVPVDALLGYLLADGEAVPEAKPKPSAAASPQRARRRRAAVGSPAGGDVRSTPGARRLAAKLGVDLSGVTPTGPGGRVVEADVRALEAQQKEPAAPAFPLGLPEPSETTALAGMRKSIASHMKGSLAGTAQLSFFLDLDVTDAQALRKEASSSGGATIGIAHVIMKACAGALGSNPQLNTVLSGDTILRFDQVDMGVAVSLREGLIVPVVRGVEGKSIQALADETADLAEKARRGALSPDEVAGGTFTISVLGSVDGFTPILNAGQSAILGVGRSVEKPVVRKGEVVVREMMTVSLTVDHQVIDGAVAASFLRRLQQLIERPAPLFK